MTSWIQLLDKIEALALGNKFVRKFYGEFREQMPNFATKDEKYPIVWVTPIQQTLTSNLNYFDIDIYCVDIIQKDRDNINTIVSDCFLILNDLYLQLKWGDDYAFDVITDPYILPLNNFDLDYVAGGVLRMTVEVGTYGVCDTPYDQD